MNIEFKNIKKSRQLAMRGVLIALAMILSYAESLIPFDFIVPGAKLGLANIVTIFAVLYMSLSDALLIGSLRVILTTILFGNVVMMIYSLAGAVTSILLMFLCSRLKKFGILGISVVGAVCHNAAQCIVASIMIQNKNILGYLPLLVIFGVLSGCLTGTISSQVINRLKNISYFSE